MFAILKMLLVFSIALIGATAVAAPANIVPKPSELIWGKDTFTLQTSTRILADEKSRAVAELAASQLRQASGFPLNIEIVKNSPLSSNAITLKVVKDASLNREAYLLHVSKDGVLILGSSSVGLFYGVQTLRQLFPVEMFSENHIERAWSIPTCRIKDAPTFPWRGMMLDVSRYWFTKEYLFKYLDIMATHKMNVLHLHLIDDCGWRLEIKAYPKLSEIGGFRGTGKNRYGGFYTQDDMREIIAYGEARGITIVPEIELPAHTLSALVAYPELSCTGVQHSVPPRHFISKDLYCAGKPSTWIFLKKVLDEVADVFPGEYIHVGGDEAKYDRWRSCKECQSKMKELGLTKEKELQGWMTREVENYLSAKGKRIIGWDEIMACGVTTRTGIMPWHNPATATKGALQGNPVVMSLTKHCYFDTVESKHPGEPPGAGWLQPISLEQAYKWDPMP
ncbi:MAG: beta-N-acetylhexosaminidase, partial [Kiritimatiellae bacterium]|nr:beta-N-acetylhexosaminidase [Kiritimatiellia bacterium]